MGWGAQQGAMHSEGVGSVEEGFTKESFEWGIEGCIGVFRKDLGKSVFRSGWDSVLTGL